MSGSFLLWLFETSGVHGVSSSRLEQFPSVQQGVNSPEEGMCGWLSLPVWTPIPIQLAEGPPRVGEGCRDHMTLTGPRPAAGLSVEAQGRALPLSHCSVMAAVACVQLILPVCLARAHFCPVGISKNLLQTSTVLVSLG